MFCIFVVGSHVHKYETNFLVAIWHEIRANVINAPLVSGSCGSWQKCAAFAPGTLHPVILRIFCSRVCDDQPEQRPASQRCWQRKPCGPTSPAERCINPGVAAPGAQSHKQVISRTCNGPNTWTCRTTNRGARSSHGRSIGTSHG